MISIGRILPMLFLYYNKENFGEILYNSFWINGDTVAKIEFNIFIMFMVKNNDT
ncbi:hypothetical protein G6554_00765 [Bacillus sp. MM2020_4]|nr:hypothetical protein [Bacillus sp. MM2020_4]